MAFWSDRGWSSLGVRRIGAGVVLGMMIAAIVCCDLSPAWSPDGKRVLFPVRVAGDGTQLVEYELASAKSRFVCTQPGYLSMRAAFGEDGTVYVVACREVEDESKSDEALVQQRLVLDFLVLEKDGKTRLLATPPGSAEAELFGPVFVRDGRLWSWVTAGDPPATTSDDAATPEVKRLTCQWIDLASGAITLPFAERSVIPLQGKAGLYYVEGFEDREEPGPVMIGRLRRDEHGGYATEELARRTLEFGATGVAAVGARHIALVGEQKIEGEGEGEGEGEARKSSYLLLFDVDGEQMAQLDLPGEGSCGRIAFGADDESVWITRRDGQQLLRVDVKAGATQTLDVDSLLPEDTPALAVFGIALSPTAGTLAMTLLQDKDGADPGVPALLLLDEGPAGRSIRTVVVQR